MKEVLTIALPTGRLGKSALKNLKAIDMANDVSLKSRKLTFIDEDNIKYIMVKPVDVITYVEKGVADIGVIGSDVIMEQEGDIYEALDLGFGQCKMSLAGFANSDYPFKNNNLTIATKYPNITKKYYRDSLQKIDIIKINGSVELAPLLGLSDVIVDIVETGNTLRANGLDVIEDMIDISAKAIVNKVSYRFKNELIISILEKLKANVGETND